MTTLGEKLVFTAQPAETACWLPDYLAESYRRETQMPVNDPRSLAGDDLLLVSGNVTAGEIRTFTEGPSCVAFDANGQIARHGSSARTWRS